MDEKEIANSVMKSLESGLRKGWYRFKDGSMTVDKWVKLSDDEKENYPIGFTKLGKKESAGNDLMKFAHSPDVMDMLVEDIKSDDDGNIEIKLTKSGEMLRSMYKMTGMSFSKFLQERLKKGINKEFIHCEVINNKTIRGQLRL